MVAFNGTRNYINDFSNISIITRNISTIRQRISIYRQITTILTHPSPYFYQYITISSMLKYRKHLLVK
ncbi:hypothetical protein COM02_20520 [Bacillus toyonensis]|nr:hypothetical protein COM02_20520 [Bacillus toyonensis]PHD33723.1 hypothetical protein COF48_16170 [Bacillus toyonensis]